MTAAGWIKLFRKFREWRWYKDDKTKSVFIELLLLANHKDHAWQGMTVQRGQLVTSLPSIAKALGISVQNVRTALDHLVSTGEISQEITNSYRLVTVNNWAIYQGEEGEKTDEVTGDQQANQQAKHKQINRQKRQHKAVKTGIATNKSTGKSTDEVTADIEDIDIDREIYIKGAVPPELSEAVFAFLGGIPPIAQSDITEWLEQGQCEPSLIQEALEKAKRAGGRSWNYIAAIVNGEMKAGIRTGQELKNKAEKAKNKDERGINAGGKYREKVDWEQHFNVIED